MEHRHEFINSEQKFRGLIETARDSIVVLNQLGKIIFVNHQVERWFGYLKSELIGRELNVLVPKGNDLVGKRKDGSTFPVELSFSPSESNEGRLVTTVIRDISDNKKRERQAELVARLGQRLTETLDFDVIINDSAEMLVPDFSDYCVIRIADGTGKLYSKKVAHKDPKMVDRYEEFVQKLETSKVIQDALGDLIKKGKTIVSVPENSFRCDVDPELRRITNEIGIHSYIVVPLIPRNTVAGTLSFVMTDSHREFQKEDIKFFEDIGHRIALSMENAKLYKDATQAIKTREEVLSVVSHDLKSPIAAIKMRLEVMRRAKVLSEEKLVEHTDKITKTLDHMQSLICDLLDFAKLESGTFSLDRCDHTLKEVVMPVVEIIEPQAHAKNIKFHVNIFEGEYIVNCDVIRIRQVLSNLLGNALKFTQEGGTIHLVVSKIEDRLEFCVTDTGWGIASENIDKVFERFWQSTTTKKMGSGLGLSICKAIVEAHGGRIWVESELQVGSKFFFSIS